MRGTCMVYARAVHGCGQPAACLARWTARDHLCEGIRRHHGRGEGDSRLDEHDAVHLCEALRHVLERERDQSIVQPAARLQQVRVPLVELDVATPRDRRVLRAIDLDHGGRPQPRPRGAKVLGIQLAYSSGYLILS